MNAIVIARGRAAGFTLLELLVVMAIIGFLAALVLPSLNRAKDRAQQIQCVNNLHQQGVALHSILADNRSYPLWIAPSNREPAGRWWAEQLARGGFGISQPAPSFWQQGVWRCPSAKPRDGQLADMPYYGYNAFGMLKVGNLTNNFGLLGHSVDSPATRIPIRESEVVAPTEMMAIGESDSFAFMRNLPYDFRGSQLRHQTKANVLYCDGHVESPAQRTLFEDTSDAALARWNRDHLPHRDRL